MSQVLLGVRNLSLRIAVFVALAAALAWILGGELFPRAKSLPRAAIADNGVSARIVMWYTPDGIVSERAHWRLEVDAGKGARRVEPAWAEATDPVVTADGRVHVGGLLNGVWSVWTVDPNGDAPQAVVSASYGDRLEVERQLGRLAFGFPLQDPARAQDAREAMLRAGDER